MNLNHFFKLKKKNCQNFIYINQKYFEVFENFILAAIFLLLHFLHFLKWEMIKKRVQPSIKTAILKETLEILK